MYFNIGLVDLIRFFQSSTFHFCFSFIFKTNESINFYTSHLVIIELGYLLSFNRDAFELFYSKCIFIYTLKWEKIWQNILFSYSMNQLNGQLNRFKTQHTWSSKYLSVMKKLISSTQNCTVCIEEEFWTYVFIVFNYCPEFDSF